MRFGVAVTKSELCGTRNRRLALNKSCTCSPEKRLRGYPFGTVVLGRFLAAEETLDRAAAGNDGGGDISDRGATLSQFYGSPSIKRRRTAA